MFNNKIYKYKYFFAIASLALNEVTCTIKQTGSNAKSSFNNHYYHGPSMGKCPHSRLTLTY